MALVASARTTGSGHLLWPAACKSVEDVPTDLSAAIDHAIRVLGWHESALSKDEIPPSWMWHLDHEMETWWAEIDRKRSAGSSGAAVEDGPMEQNLYAARLRDG